MHIALAAKSEIQEILKKEIRKVYKFVFFRFLSAVVLCWSLWTFFKPEYCTIAFNLTLSKGSETNMEELTFIANVNDQTMAHIFEQHLYNMS